MTVITKQGHQQLQKELTELEAKLPHITERIQNAVADGDLSENNAYHNAKRDLALTRGRIAEIKRILHYSKVKKITKKDCCQLGSQVTITLNDQEKTFTLVGDHEANPAQQKISIRSPLGKTLINRKIGETVQMETPNGKVPILIKSIK